MRSAQQRKRYEEDRAAQGQRWIVVRDVAFAADTDYPLVAAAVRILQSMKPAGFRVPACAERILLGMANERSG